MFSMSSAGVVVSEALVAITSPDDYLPLDLIVRIFNTLKVRGRMDKFLVGGARYTSRLARA